MVCAGMNLLNDCEKILYERIAEIQQNREFLLKLSDLKTKVRQQTEKVTRRLLNKMLTLNQFISGSASLSRFHEFRIQENATHQKYLQLCFKFF